MSPIIGVTLFVIGVGALLLSILMDRRPPSRKPAADTTTEVGRAMPDGERAVLATDEPEVTEARLEMLRAEFVGARPQPGPTASPEPAITPERPQVTETSARPEAGHGHAISIVSHSDLVSHVRREHPDLESGGSTIQMRRLHDGAHAS
jgi:hypothetical protein